jgi:hypothetical protein
MPSIILSDNGVSSGSAGLKQIAASDGALALQTTTGAGVATTAVTIDTSQNVTLTNGTANGVAYLNGSKVLTTGSALVFDGTNVGLGVTPSAWFANSRLMQLGSGASLEGRSTFAPYASLGANVYINSAGNNIYLNNGTASALTQDNAAFKFYTAASGTAGNAITFTQAMTLDSSGNLLVGTTSSAAYVNANSALIGTPSGFSSGLYLNHASGVGGGNLFQGFGLNATQIGSITQNGTTGVLYNVTSDYRLKNDQQALTGAKEFVMALQPKKWQWWDGSGEGVGFVAHEFMEVAKHSGQGEKDAVDADGKPVYQSIQPSSSEVMANLVAHIQNLETRLAALESN